MLPCAVIASVHRRQAVEARGKNGDQFLTTEPLERRRLLASPEVDLTFGEGGLAKIDESGDFHVVRQLPDGRILAAGGTHFEGALVARFNADGSPDTTFDGDGTLKVPAASSMSDGAVGPDGKIVLIQSFDLDDPVRVFRFNADGSIDTTFGVNGVVAVTDRAIGRAVAVQADGKIIVGYDDVDINELLIVRLNTDGSIDSTFRGGTASPQPLPRELRDLDLDVAPNGKIYLVGDEVMDAPEQSVVGRLNADGSVDTSFSGDGFELVVDGSVTVIEHGETFPGRARLSAIAVDAQNRPVVTSQFNRGNADQSTILTRFTTAGAHDPTFGGGDGWAEFETGGPRGKPVIFGPGDKITIALSTVGGNPNIFRLNADGTPDLTFGDRGRTSPEHQVVSADAMSLDAEGNILVAGSMNEPPGLAVTRFVPEAPEVVLDRTGTVHVAMTEGHDTVTLRRDGGQVVVRRNGVSTSFGAADVKALRIERSSGNDTISVSFALPCTIDGGAGNDVITVGDGRMSLVGGEGDDVVVAGVGAHRIRLGDGNDRSTTGAGNDTIEAGDGNDTITTGPGGDRIFADIGDGVFARGDDSITTAGGYDTIYTGDGDDTVRAGAGHDLVEGHPPVGEGGFGTAGGGGKLIFGGDGDDVLLGGNGASTVFGGAGSDRIEGQHEPDYLDGGSGDDQIGGQSGFENFVPPAGDTVIGGDGHDNLGGSRGPDMIFGDGGDDTLNGSGSRDVLHGGAGTDSITSFAGDAVLDGTPAPVTVAGGVLTFSGTAGDDAISIWAEGNTVSVWLDGAVVGTFSHTSILRIVIAGNAGNDFVKIHRLFAVSSVLIGGSGDDHLIGGASTDALLGGDGNDHLTGNGGADRLDGGFGADEMAGGLGVDTLDYRSRGGPLSVRLDNARGDGEARENDNAAADIEVVHGGGGDDFLDGGAAHNTLYGGAGNETLVGGDGHDRLLGGSGNDRAAGDGGDDSLYGGSGVDTLLGGRGGNAFLDLDPLTPTLTLTFHGSDFAADDVSLLEQPLGELLVVRHGTFTHTMDLNGIDRVELNGYGGDDYLNVDESFDPLTLLRGGTGNDELISGLAPATLVGGEGDDQLFGGRSFNVIEGGDGNDTITGSNGSDTMDGGAGNDHIRAGDNVDSITGGPGNDSLFGEAGNDRLQGEDGDDYFEGGSGNDTLHGNAGADALFGLSGNDRLFAAGDDTADTLRGGSGTDVADADGEDDVLAVETVL